MKKKPSVWNRLAEAPMPWDNSDSEPVSATPRNSRRPPPVPIKIKDAQGRPIRNGLPGVSMRNEAAPTPFQSARYSRSQKPTRDLFVQGSFDVTVPGEGTFRVQAATAEEARQGIVTWFLEDQENGGKRIDPNTLVVARTPKEQPPSNESTERAYKLELETRIRKAVQEIIRKKKGGGGFNLYSPNKGKKNRPKLVGEFPTRVAAKRAELARFPPKDAEQLKRARARLDQLSKDPKKRARVEKNDLSGRKKVTRHGVPARDRKKHKNESFSNLLAKDLMERLFREDEIPGSPWDERISAMHPDALSSDKKLSALHKGMETAAIGSLGDAHKGLAKALRGMAKVHPGDIAHDENRRKMFMPVVLDCDGTEIGPLHLYVDGGHVKIEVSQDARSQITKMDPDAARSLRGGLMSFEEDHLPGIDRAKRAWADRDAYLDKIHGRLEKHASGLSPIEQHLMKRLLRKGGDR